MNNLTVFFVYILQFIIFLQEKRERGHIQRPWQGEERAEPYRNWEISAGEDQKRAEWADRDDAAGEWETPGGEHGSPETEGPTGGRERRRHQGQGATGQGEWQMVRRIWILCQLGLIEWA